MALLPIGMLYFASLVKLISVSPADMVSAETALGNATVTTEVPAQSGAILDRNGLVLAEDRCVWNLVINYFPDDRSLVHGLGEGNLTAADIDKKIQMLADGCGIEFRKLWAALMVNPSSSQVLREGLTPSERSVIRAAMKRVPYSGLSLKQEFQRIYPNGRVLSHLIGLRPLAKELQVKGVTAHPGSGFEKGLLEYLEGVPGERSTISVTGKHGVNPALGKRDAVAGPSIRTSVDLKLSEYARQQLALLMEEHNPWRTMTIVVDVKTGQILSLIGLPDYDPSDIGGSLQERLNPETGETAAFGLVNPARWNFTPGSTFKPLTAALALERDAIRENQKFDDHNGLYSPPRGGADPIKNARGVPNVPMRAFEGIIYSSNIVFAQVAREIGREGMADMLDFYGYSNQKFQIHGLDQTFEPRFTRPRSEFFLERSPDNMAYLIPRMGYGHGVNVPPLQHAMAMAAIANGGTLFDATFDPESEGENPRKILSESTTSYVKEAMLWMVNMASRDWLPHREDLAYCGKSGTATIRGGAFKDKYTSSFVCYGPYEDPEVLVLVVSYGTSKGRAYGANHYGSKVSGPAAANILHRALELRGSLPANGNGGLDWAACPANLDR